MSFAPRPEPADPAYNPLRRTLRLGLEILHPATGLNPSGLLHALAPLLAHAGLQVAPSREKRPRPQISLGPLLPLGVESLGEWAQAELSEPPNRPLPALQEQLNASAPKGLRITSLEIVPNHGSPLLELAQEAQWRWLPPEDLKDMAPGPMKAFEAADSFELEKVGKVEGAKTVKRREVRSIVTAMAWREHALFFSTRLEQGEALSPLKLLAAILGVEPARITGLTRLAVILGDDPRLAEPHAFEPKLHNMYEDAVLLESDDTLRIVDEDDERIL
ncbi:MAG: DUF2344 domain-containing protein [Firmicutes bacterium]|nr:DUF2344 domain-containing protein [Bacillota bacterium]